MASSTAANCKTNLQVSCVIQHKSLSPKTQCHLNKCEITTVMLFVVKKIESTSSTCIPFMNTVESSHTVKWSSGELVLYNRIVNIKEQANDL